MSFNPEKIDFRKLDRTLVIAELGVNHEGSMARAVEMIRLAARTGADAVKFQTYDPAGYVSTEQEERFARVSRFRLTHDQFRELAVEAKRAGIVFFSTPLAASDATFLAEIAPMLKISSGDIDYLELLETAAKLDRPLIVSTGAATYEEIDGALATIDRVNPSLRATGRLLVMHCVAAYPPGLGELNLANVRSLARRTGLPVGYSDHSIGTKACELAVAAGAVAIEKHFTYRREGQTFHDHAVSADPAEMTELVATIRRAEILLGNEERVRTTSEEKLLPYLRRSLAASVDIPAGAPLQAEWITAVRPIGGLPLVEKPQIVGRRLTRTLAKGALIRAEDLVPR